MRLLKIFTLLFFLLVSMSCEKEESDNKEAPEIPPQSTFIMDVSDFANNQDTSTKYMPDSTAFNYFHSVLSVAFWNFMLTAHMIIPVAAFVESFNHEAIYHPTDDNWTWSYNINVGGIHEVELTGYIESDSVIWEMRIDELLWYYGHSHTDGTGGYWKLFQGEDLSIPWLNIDWNRESTDIADLKYTIITPDDEGYGSYIFYGKTNEEYDRFYDIYLSKEDKLTEIEWLFEEKNGRVRDFRRFGDNEWHCWDSTYIDVNCN